VIKTGLEFAPGTTDDCRRLVHDLFQPGDLLTAYREARQKFMTGDLVLVTAESDPSQGAFAVRTAYANEVRRAMGSNAPALMAAWNLGRQAAHSVARLPFEDDAFWLVVNRHQALPVEVVLFASPYEEQDTPDPGQATILG
jgi:hypothetical protein